MGGRERKEVGEIRQFGGREVTICLHFVVCRLAVVTCGVEWWW